MKETGKYSTCLGRGFVLWEPHLEVSKVLLGLLDMASEADKWVPSQIYGLPLTPGSLLYYSIVHVRKSVVKRVKGVYFLFFE